LWCRQAQQHQPAAFRAQLQLAREMQMPVQLHVRSANRDRTYRADAAALRIVREGGMDRHGMQRHCFMGDALTLRTWLNACPNTMFGFTNAVFAEESHERLKLAVRECPLDHILIETDAPFFTPRLVCARACHLCTRACVLQYQGSADISHPGHALLVARFIADAKQLPLNDVAEQLAMNMKKLYSIDV
jgi:TatD DNase family protein